MATPFQKQPIFTQKDSSIIHHKNTAELADKSNHSLKFSLFDTYSDTQPARLIDFDDLAGFCKTPVTYDGGEIKELKSRTPCFLPCDAARKTADVTEGAQFSLLVADIDEGNRSLADLVCRLERLECRALIYSTLSATKGDLVWRVVLPLFKSVTVDIWGRYARALRVCLGGDASMDRKTQLSFIPAKSSPEALYQWQLLDKFEAVDLANQGHPLTSHLNAILADINALEGGNVSSGSLAPQIAPTQAENHTEPTPFNVSVITSTNPARLTKKWAIVDGKPVKEHAGNMVLGNVEPRTASNPEELAEIIRGLNQNQALCFGVPLDGQCHPITTKNKLAKSQPGTIARTNDYFRWTARTGWLFLDLDQKDGEKTLSRNEWFDALETVAPGIMQAGRVWSPSSSSLIFNGDAQISGVTGQHLYIQVADASDIPRAGKALAGHLWRGGYGWIEISKSGAMLERTIVDTAVWQTSRLDFAAAPVCEAPLNRRGAEVIPFDGAPLDTRKIIDDSYNEIGFNDAPLPTAAEIIHLKKLEAKPEADRIREKWICSRVEELIARNPGLSTSRARKVAVNAAEHGTLYGDFLIYLDDGKEIRVHDLLGSTSTYDGRLTLDPVEPDYQGGKVVGKLFLLDGHPTLYSAAHGGFSYTLKPLLAQPVNTPPAVLELAERIETGLYGRLGEFAPATGFDIDLEALTRIINNCFWSGVQGKLYMLGIESDLLQFPGGCASEFISRRFGEFINLDVIREAAGKKALHDALTDAKATKFITSSVACPGAEVVKHLQLYAQRNAVDWRVDMFAGHDELEMVEDRVRITLTHKPLPVSGKHHDPAIIADYKKHFGRLDAFIDLVVAARVAGDRKKSYLWIYADSDWGKGLLLAALQQTGIVVTTSGDEVEAMLSGKPVGRQPSDFKRALILAIDEFKNVKSEFKQLQSTIELAPKFQFTSRVEVFTKLFLSAEGVGSLAGEHGVEDQFCNRFSLFREHGSIEDRDVFKRFGKAAYRDAIADYIADQVNTLVEQYRAMGRDAATKAGDDFVTAFHEEHGIDNHYRRFSETLPDLASSFVDWVLNVADPVLGYSVHDNSGRVFLVRPGKAYSHFLADTVDGSELVSLKRKRDSIFSLISADKVGEHSYKINGKTLRGICIR